VASLESEIDHLYQVPLGEFTAARNALARRAGPRAADVKALAKPTLAAWAINQLFWQNRAVYDALVERAADLRATHAAALRGKRTDLRGASKAHDESLDAALKATLSLLANSGQAVTDATKQALATTLRALPGTEPAGRLSRQLQPGGFEMLAAVAPSSGRARAAAPRPEPPRRETRPISRDDRDRTAARLAAARESAAASARATRDAEQVVRREQFEAARAVREAEKAGRRVEEAEAALKTAQQELAEAKREAAAAARARETADRRARQAADALARARKAQASAEEEVEKLR
jgi:hypothetical protein